MPSGSIPHGHERPDAANRHAEQADNFDDSYELALAQKLRPAIIAIPAAAIIDRNLDDEALFVFSGICAYLNADGQPWISINTLAKIIHRRVTTVQAAVDRLKALGYLDQEVYPHE